MNLPPALAPWARELDLFPSDLAVSLGGLVRRLDSLIGPLRNRGRGSDGEPDGYADIARRGPYERLLLSEWLLATEEPDEWTRRAVAGEHAFLALSRRKPVTNRLSLVLFDTGPSQWGSARLAHLAALIVLQRRSRAAGAKFAWGILQQAPPAPEAPQGGEADAAGVLRLVRGVSAREPGAADLSAWAAHFSAPVGKGRSARKDFRPDFGQELWLVGGARLAQIAGSANARLLGVREESEAKADAPDDAAAQVTRFLVASFLQSTEAAGALSDAPEMRLPLPPPPVCVRLLRDPFGDRVHSPLVPIGSGKPREAREAAVSDLLFSLHGSKLFARGGARGGTSVLAYPVGNSPAANMTSPPRQYRSQFGTPFFAAGRIGKSTIIASLASGGTAVNLEVVRGGDGLRAGSYRLTSKVDLPSSSDPAHDALQTGRLVSILPLYTPQRIVSELVTILPNERLVRLRWDAAANEGIAEVMGLRCLAFSRVTEGVAFVGVTGKAVAHFLLRDTPAAGGANLERQLEVPVDALVLWTIPFTAFLHVPAVGDAVVALQEVVSGTSRITVASHNKVRHFTLPAGQRLVGIDHETEVSTVPILLLLSGDGKTVSTAAADKPEETRPLFHAADSRIVRVTKSPFGRFLAFATESGDVGIWSIDHKDYVYRQLPALARTEPAASESGSA